MTNSFRTLDDVDVKGKRVLVRVDLNVPMDNGKITDATRLERIAPTVTEIAGKGGKVILLAHFGRPKGVDPKQSLKPVAAALAEVVGKPVAFADDCVGDVAAKAVAAMKDGDILCLENTRFHLGEEKNDPAFVAELAKLGDIWVADAFSAAGLDDSVAVVALASAVPSAVPLTGVLLTCISSQRRTIRRVVPRQPNTLRPGKGLRKPAPSYERRGL